MAHEVHVAEASELAVLLMRRASLAEGLAGRPLVLHSDNGSAMKGAIMLATLEQLGVAASFSRLGCLMTIRMQIRLRAKGET